MSSYSQRPSFATVLRSFGSDEGLPFADVLTEKDIEQACKEEKVSFGGGQHDVYTPAVTLWAFLSQVLDHDHSCRQVIARLFAWLASRGPAPRSADTGAYCKARARFPEAALRQLARDRGRSTSAAVEKLE